jgi:hypothetical protein
MGITVCETDGYGPGCSKRVAPRPCTVAHPVCQQKRIEENGRPGGRAQNSIYKSDDVNRDDGDILGRPTSAWIIMHCAILYLRCVMMNSFTLFQMASFDCCSNAELVHMSLSLSSFAQKSRSICSF